MAVDMAPVRYQHGFDGLFSALQAVDLGTLASRSDAEAMLVERLGDRALAQYLLQNLGLQDGRYYWRMNLRALVREIDSILDFPAPGDRRFPGKAWFVYGGQSDYVTPAYNRVITELFPHARLRMLAGAGHWVYAEKPEEFLTVVGSFVQGA
jgi:pimeloyl-ACP methyl ester carboxylesterase